MGDSITEVLPAAFLDDPDPDVQLGDFFDPGFMQEYTQFETFAAFCAESPWELDGAEDLEAVPTAELDRYVRRTTRFDGWVAMRNRAASREVRNDLLL